MVLFHPRHDSVMMNDEQTILSKMVQTIVEEVQSAASHALIGKIICMTKR
jgi:hypothetical protein